MQKIFAALFLAVAILAVSPVQAHFDLNKNSAGQFVNLTTGSYPAGEVVNIQTYLSIRESPTVHSRELLRVPNGTRLGICSSRTVNGFYEVVCWANPNTWRLVSGWAHSSYVVYSGGYFELP